MSNIFVYLVTGGQSDRKWTFSIMSGQAGVGVIEVAADSESETVDWVTKIRKSSVNAEKMVIAYDVILLLIFTIIKISYTLCPLFNNLEH